MRNYFLHACICALAYMMVRDYLASIYVVGFIDGKDAKLQPMQCDGKVINYPFRTNNPVTETKDTPATESKNDEQ